MLGHGRGPERRRRYAMVGDLLLLQAPTLFTTPMVYLCLDPIHRRSMRGARRMFCTVAEESQRVPAPRTPCRSFPPANGSI